MNTSLDPMSLPATSAAHEGPAERLTNAAVPASTVVKPTAKSSSPQLSTDLRVDDQHRVYYEFVDERTGSVLFEIPPETLREIGESSKMSTKGEASGNNVDVKS